MAANHIAGMGLGVPPLLRPCSPFAFEYPL